MTIVPRIKALVLLAALAVAGGPIPGCTTFQPGNPARLAIAATALPIPPEDWPARKTDNLQALCTATPKAIYSVVAEGHPITEKLPDTVRTYVEEPAAKITYCGIHGPGLLRVFEYSGPDAKRRGMTGSMRFVSHTTRTDLPTDPRLTKFAERQVKAIADRIKDVKGLKAADTDVLRMLSEGTAIRIVEPSGKTPIRGTVVYMSGLGSIPYEQAIADELSARGWWLVRVATPRVWWYESKPWYIGSRDDVPRIARELAGVLDDMVAEPAFAAQAALDYLAEARPEVPQAPLAVVAFSAGALVAPVIVARMPDRFNAAVLVGGGANLLEISQTSDLTTGGIRLAWPDDQPRGDWRKQLFKDYLEYSRLDPYHTARFLRHKPVLTVTANLDLTVPAKNGWLLWDRLGRPDQYMHVGEHRTLFLTVHNQSKRIADWLEQHISGGRDASPMVQIPASSRPETR